MSNLKPCPFCGGGASLWYCTADGKLKSNLPNAVLWGQRADHKVIVCERCGAQTKIYATNRVFNAWNRRAEE